MWKLKNGNGLLLMFTWRLGKWVCWTICQLTSRSSLSALQHECFFARGKLGGLEQREPARGLQWVWNWLLVPDPPVNLSPTRLKSSRRQENARPAAALIAKTCWEANCFLITYVMILVSHGEFYFNSMNLWTIIVMSDNNLTRKEQNAKEWVWLGVVQINAEYKWCSCKLSTKLLKIHEL